MTASPSQSSNLREIPSVDQLLRTPTAAELRKSIGVQRLTAMARNVIEGMRTELKSAGSAKTKDELLQQATEHLQELSGRERATRLQRVINATGVILHTNLGRAPLSEAARNAIANEAAGYCTLEYDLETGTRGKRASHVEELLTQLTGAEAALVVNNCASAALLILSVLAREGETLVSRGELVEIGGDFRVPEVMANSGTRMVEVGTTNRTTLDDYQRAINSQTRLVMRVHPSNYRVVGFTTTPKLGELASLAHDAGLLIYEDAGSGVVNDLSKLGLGDEPLISESIEAGVDVVSFSGDKLLGASQAGLIVGRQEIIDRLRKHSMYRALRADKLCLAALEVTLEAHRRQDFDQIPALRMLALSENAINERATQLISKLTNRGEGELAAEIISGESAVGGGSGPDVHPPTALIALKHPRLKAAEIEHRLRSGSPPVISRINEDRALLDLRTVDPSEEPELVEALIALDS